MHVRTHAFWVRRTTIFGMLRFISVLASVAVLSAAQSVPVRQVPAYEVDPMWPKPLPNNWLVGAIAGIAVDARNHVWIVHRPGTLQPNETRSFWRAAPPVLTHQGCNPAVDRGTDQIRGLPVDKALNILSFSPKKGAVIIKKVLLSAIANAEHNDGADVDELKVKTILVDKATNLRRFTARAKGRGNVILKQTCHIPVTVGDGK